MNQNEQPNDLLEARYWLARLKETNPTSDYIEELEQLLDLTEVSLKIGSEPLMEDTVQQTLAFVEKVKTELDIF